MNTRTLDCLPPDDAVALPTAAQAYLDAELTKLTPDTAAALCSAVVYAEMIHGALTLREMQMVCAVAAMLRLKGR